MNKKLIKKLNLNRRFEFRVWHEPTSRMYYNVKFDAHTLWLNNEGESLYVKDCILMQWSGLFDRHGNKVWEGDILYYEYDPKQHDPDTDEPLYCAYYPVVFAIGSFGTAERGEPVDPFATEGALQRGGNAVFYQRIGNVFEDEHYLSRSDSHPFENFIPDGQASANNLTPAEA